MTQPDLDLGVVGNGSFGALVDKHARVVWSCLPTFDGDPTFCALLSPNQQEGGDFAIELEDFASSEQSYLTNTAARWKSSTSPRAGARTTASTDRSA